jgi:hypothetical protein
MKLPTLTLVLALLAPLAIAAPAKKEEPVQLRYVTLERMLKQFSREAEAKRLAAR